MKVTARARAWALRRPLHLARTPAGKPPAGRAARPDRAHPLWAYLVRLVAAHLILEFIDLDHLMPLSDALVLIKGLDVAGPLRIEDDHCDGRRADLPAPGYIFQMK